MKGANQLPVLFVKKQNMKMKGSLSPSQKNTPRSSELPGLKAESRVDDSRKKDSLPKPTKQGSKHHLFKAFSQIANESKISKEKEELEKENEVKLLKAPKNWGVRHEFSRSNSPKIKRVDDMLKTNPFWKNDFEYNFKVVDRTFFENYYCDESLVKENTRTKIFDEVEFGKYDVKMNQLIELIKSSRDELVLKGRRLDDDFLNYFIKNSNINITTQKLVLNRNNLSGEGAINLLKRVNEVIVTIDLSHNFIFPLGGEAITRILTNAHTKLQNLSLSNCKIKDESAKKLFFSIMLNKTLRVLKLSHNQISNECSEHISMILQQNTSLREFYISWNQLTSVSARNIAEALFNNKNLKVLDLSFNKLGDKHSELSCAKSFKDLLSRPTGLIHLDLSHTNFTLNEAKLIAEGLNQNHTLYGFHFQGNPGRLDILGNLVFCEEKNEKCLNFAKTYFPIEGVSINQYAFQKPHIRTRRKKHDSIDHALSEAINCWICEGWVEHTFEFFFINRLKDANEVDKACFIHFDLDDWQPLEMDVEKGKYTFKRIFPPRKIYYFFSYQGKQVISRSHFTEKNPEPHIKININGEIKEFFLPKLNCEVLTPNKLISEDYSINVSQIPRKKFNSESKHFLDQIQKAKASSLGRESSIFSNFEIDTEDMLNKCLDNDWKNCKYLREIKISAESLKALHDIIFSVYVYIKDCHKSYCSIDHIKKKFFVMSKANFSMFQTDLSSVFKLKLTQDEINNIYQNSLAPGKKSWAADALTRSEFLEVLIRMSSRIYFHEVQIPSRFSTFLRDGFFVFLKEFHQQPLRDEVFWSYNNQMAIEGYMNILRHIFQKYARTAYYNEKYGEHITIIEFQEIWRDCMENKGREFISSNEVEKCFYLSQATQIFDTSSKRHSIISFVEFLEAIIRITSKIKEEKLNVSRGSVMSSPTRGFSSPKKNSVAFSELSLSVKSDSSPLHIKLERLLWNMGDLVDDPNIQVNRFSIFNENLSDNSASPRSPKRQMTICSPKLNTNSLSPLSRSRTFELNNIGSPAPQTRTIQVIKSKFNQLLGLSNLPLN